MLFGNVNQSVCNTNIRINGTRIRQEYEVFMEISGEAGEAKSETKTLEEMKITSNASDFL